MDTPEPQKPYNIYTKNYVRKKILSSAFKPNPH